MKRICTICARGGSKGVKGKNIRPLLGKPLIAHSIEQARMSGLFSALVVSSDSEDIRNAAKAAGADLTIDRPLDLASDTAAKLPAIQHCVAQAEAHFKMEFDTIVDLDATSPLRISEDIEGAVRLLETTGATNVITGAPARRSPYFNLVEIDPHGTARLSKPLPQATVRRQDSPKCFDMNASIYVWRRDVLLGSPLLFHDGTRLYEMPEDRSVDIDCELDFTIVELIMSQRGATKVEPR